MNKLFIGKKYLPVWLALAAIAAVGAAPKFAEAATGAGNGGPAHYNADGSISSGWSASAPSGKPVAQAPATFNSGYGAFAQAPASTYQPAGQPWPGSSEFGIRSVR